MPLENAQVATIVVSAVALAVSSTALLWSTLQLIHSFLGSAKGYSHINKEVMPGWHQFRRRRFVWGQFRVRVKYDTPIFIVCSVQNEKFPISEQTALFIGEPEGDRKTRDQKGANQQHKNVKITKSGKLVTLIPTSNENGVHTVDNERATWVTLLEALHMMETKSEAWETQQYAPGSDKPPPFSDRTLAVAIQRKKRNWDNMPSSITKPYATTTICHIMEMAAMLGLHWKEFDRGKERYLAEGNGYVLNSTSVSELGTVFTFQRRGSNIFEANRTIPVEELKDFAFGFVPTIYGKNGVSEDAPEDAPEDPPERSRLTALTADEFKDLKYLQMGSPNELAETLISLGCTTQVSELIRKNDTKQRHLYPLAFEVVGMLAKILHVKRSFFRTLPNPTFYQWDERYFSLSEILMAFTDEMTNRPPLTPYTDRLRDVFEMAKGVRTALKNQSEPSRNVKKADHAAYLDSLHNALKMCDKNLKGKQDDARQILSRHIEAVLAGLNPGTQISSVQNVSATNEEPTPEAKKEENERKAAFLRLNSAENDDKEKQLISLYFKHLFPQIRQALRSPSDPEFVVGTEIWCTLVFRSICWLSLHDFHKNDRQPKGKSELMGSRLPVYII